MRFYIWQRNNCNEVQELEDIEEMVELYLRTRYEEYIEKDLLGHFCDNRKEGRCECVGHCCSEFNI